MAFSAQPQTGNMPIVANEPERDSMATDVESQNEGKWKPRRLELMAMTTLATISLMVALDATILVPVLPVLATDLHGTAVEAFWAGSSYLLASAVFQPFIAALSDIWGRQCFVLVSLGFFTIGSLLCAVSVNFCQLLAGRVIQGIGGGGIITMSQVIYADIVPLRQRPKYFTIVLASWTLGTVLGPLIGGVLSEKSSWRWCFRLNLPFCVVGLGMTWFFLRFSTAHSSFRSKILRVDWVGGFIFMSSLTSFLIAISWGGVQFTWKSFQTLVPLILGVLGVVVTFLWERFGAREAFMQKSLFSSVSIVAGYLCALLQGIALFMAMYYITFYFRAVRLKSPFDSGLDLLPLSLFVIPGSIVVSALITRLGKFNWAIIAGWAMSSLGAGLFILWDINTPTIGWATAMAVFGVGMGMVLTSVNFGIQAAVKIEDAGRAAAMYAFIRSLGMSIGVAVGGSVMQNLMAYDLRRRGLPVEIARNSEAYVATLQTLASSDPERIGVLQSYVVGFKGVFEVLTAICVVGFLLSLFIKHQDMNKILISRHRLETMPLSL